MSRIQQDSATMRLDWRGLKTGSEEWNVLVDTRFIDSEDGSVVAAMNVEVFVNGVVKIYTRLREGGREQMRGRWSISARRIEDRKL